MYRWPANIAYDIKIRQQIFLHLQQCQEMKKRLMNLKIKFLVETPKKGGIGLNESLDGMCKLAKALVDHEI